MNWENAGRIIATIGLIILLILGAWGIIIIAFDASPFFSGIEGNISGLFGSGSTAPQSVSTTTPTASLPESLTLSAASSTLLSGQPLSISWSDQNATGSRGFLISYSCTNDLTIQSPLPTGTYHTAVCNTNFNYTNAQSQTTLIPRLTGTQPAEASITVSAISLETGSTTASASVTVSISPTTAHAASSQPSNISSYATAASGGIYASNPYGTPNLAVRIVALGYIDPQTGAFIPFQGAYTPQAPSATMAVQFDIKNIGTKSTPPGWQFTAALPVYPAYTYPSNPEPALAPGSGIIFNLSWSLPQQNCYNNEYGADCAGCQQTYPYQYQPCPATGYPSYPPYQSYPSYGTGTLTITADPFDIVPDANRGNNVVSVSSPY